MCDQIGHDFLASNNTDQKPLIFSHPGDMGETRVPCRLTLSCHNHQATNVAISAIDVITNARHMEVMGETGQYMNTSHGMRVDELLALKDKMFLLQQTFEEPVPQCSITVRLCRHGSKPMFR